MLSLLDAIRLVPNLLQGQVRVRQDSALDENYVPVVADFNVPDACEIA